VVTVSETQPAPLRRDRAHGVVGGVCAGLGRRLGIDPLILRIGFVVAAGAGGLGVILYALAWALLPAGDGDGRALMARAAGRREGWMVASGLVLLMLAVLLLFRAWGLWVGDAIVWPLILATGGGALIWRQSQGATVVDAPARERARPGGGVGRPRRVLRLARPSLGIVALGAALVVGAALVFLWLNGALELDRDVTLAVLVVVTAMTLILAPWWLRLARGLTEERAERIRTQERAELAAHLHDSVLQTLTLMQKRASDPREVTALARRQERELREWLSGEDAHPPDASFASALRAITEEVEDDHRVAVELVVVGDRDLDDRTEALLAAAREALVNAARHAGEPESIRVYAEVDPAGLEVFIRDRGAGFDPAAVPADRRGVRESIVGRMERAGGRAEIRSSIGDGTEVALIMPRDSDEAGGAG
jgi:signal transduction histidine kinase/phage shock protein PspC (stress-responsive transcriptional regulator)